ncbi:ABC transporter permease [Dongia sedimenti]|uniref:ABC transporter permease n=1 Tax=Dongia sedimenti TaxID=3064282 RepID=A0ABU0YKY9_9PROT|nr:ABC transporter permease [Rhodospirillaceae bacterium R-7]
MAETTVESQGPTPGQEAAARTNIGLLQRLDWVRGYLLMTPTILLMCGLLIAPLASLFLRSFWTQHGFEIDKTFTLHNYWELIAPSDEVTWWSGIPFPLKNPAYAIVIVKSLLISLGATVAVLLIAYPMAYFLAFRVVRHKMLWLIIITIPFWTSYLLRVFAWKIILGYNGVINSGLIWLGVIDKPLEFLLYNPLSVIITLAHAWVAYAILPIYVSLEKIDRSLLEAATDLGDRPWERFLHVTLPLSLPGVIASTLMVFIPTVGDYVTPTLVGGPTGVMVGNTIQTLFGQRNDGPLGAALSAVVMLIVTLLVCLFLWAVGYRKMQKREAAQ